MKAFSAIVLLSLLAACSSPREGSEGSSPAADSGERRPAEKGDTIVKPHSRDTATAQPLPSDGAPMRTSAAVYQLQSHPHGFVVKIPYTYTNRSGAPLYLTNCNGDVSPGLEWESDGKWTPVWYPTMNECLSPPVVIKPGESYSDTLGLVIQEYQKEIYPEVRRSGSTRRYRLIWHQALASFDANARPFGPSVPIDQRVSNPFQLKAP
jgi:hypothetical protein